MLWKWMAYMLFDAWLLLFCLVWINGMHYGNMYVYAMLMILMLCVVKNVVIMVVKWIECMVVASEGVWLMNLRHLEQDHHEWLEENGYLQVKKFGNEVENENESMKSKVETWH